MVPATNKSSAAAAVIPSENSYIKKLKVFFEEVTLLTRFTLRFFKELFKPPYEFNELIKQAYLIGYKLFPLVAITGFIMGLVLTVQSRPTLAEFGAESWLPAMVAVSIIREIGPVITALIFAGKVGSGIGAELASMKVTEQIDAMEASGSNPFKYIVITRVVAAQIGNNVRLSGINVGIIEDIQQMTDTTVKVDMMIEEKSRKFIKVNAKALIGSDGLMGNKIVQIIPGEAGKKVIADNGILETSQSVSMDEILKKVQITCDNAASITGDLSGIMDNIYAGKGTIGKLIMDSTFAETIDAALVNIKQGTSGFKQNMDAAGHNVLLRGYFKKKERAKEKKKEEGKLERSEIKNNLYSQFRILPFRCKYLYEN